MWSKIWIFTRCSNTVEHPCGDTVTTYGQKIHMYENSFNFSKFKKKIISRIPQISQRAKTNFRISEFMKIKFSKESCNKKLWSLANLFR